MIIYLLDQHDTKNVLKVQSCNSKFLFLYAPGVMFSFIIGFILNERSVLHCEIKKDL